MAHDPFHRGLLFSLVRLGRNKIRSRADLRHSIFQATATLFQQLSIGNFDEHVNISEPDFSVETARKTFVLFIPGNLPGIGLFLVFGTTTAFRSYLHEKYCALVQWLKNPNLRCITSRYTKTISTPVYAELPAQRLGYQPHIYSTAPNLMKDLPHRPESRLNGDNGEVEIELQQAEKAIVHERNTIYVMRSLSVQRSSRYVDQRMPTDSSQDSTPSLLIMRQSTEDCR